MRKKKNVIFILLLGVICVGCNQTQTNQEKNIAKENQQEEVELKQESVEKFQNLLIKDVYTYKEMIYDENQNQLATEELSGSKIKESISVIEQDVVYESENEESEKIEINGYEKYYLYQSKEGKKIQDSLPEDIGSLESNDLNFMSTRDVENEIRQILEYANVDISGEAVIKTVDKNYYGSVNVKDVTECYILKFKGDNQEDIQVIYGDSGILGLTYSVE